jgi:sugar O-acyltransferase (sialic acid O-acetyltransferase NeuD family)
MAAMSTGARTMPSSPLATVSERRVVVYGAGGHARVVADVATCLGHDVIGLVDDLLPPGSLRGEYAVLGSSAWLRGKAGELAVALGIGDNKIREETFLECLRAGVACPAFVHPAATVAASARLSDGCIVMAGAIINPGAALDPGVIVNSGSVVEHDCQVGRFAHISPNATLTGAARLGAFAHLGAGATVLPGIEIGENSIIGAGAVVVTAVPAGVVAFGVPARVVRERT